MSRKHWSDVSYLDALRPDFGWRTEYALLGSYSADLIALVAALLALAGLDDDRGSGSKVDFATAVDQLADRVRLIVQAGRISLPRTDLRILSILDRYVRPVKQDERESSWHPKVALVKQTNGKSQQWRLWLGSRNLTRDLSWDTGLTLVGSRSGEGAEIPGLAEVGGALAKRAALPGIDRRLVQAELKAVRWLSPAHCRIDELRLLQGTEDRGLPAAPAGLKQLVVVSPFLDVTTVKTLSGWGDANSRRIVVSNQRALAEVYHRNRAAFAGFGDLLSMDAPLPADQAAEAAQQVEDSDDEEPEPRALHAKLILAETSQGHTLWVGSANATQRGWAGPNAELVARLDVSPAVAEALLEVIREQAQIVRLKDLEAPPGEDAIEERLEAARKEVVAQWEVVQRLRGDVVELTAQVDPNPSDPEVTLSVGSLNGTMAVWSRGLTSVQVKGVQPADVSELLRCRLAFGESSVSWIMCAPLDPPPDAERDRRAIIQYLDPKTFLAWIRSMLVGERADAGGGVWDAPADRGHIGRGPLARPEWWAPTIEDMLSAWTRSPDELRSIDQRINRYLSLYQGQHAVTLTEEERNAVETFGQTWTLLKRSLLGAAR